MTTGDGGGEAKTERGGETETRRDRWIDLLPILLYQQIIYQICNIRIIISSTNAQIII